MAKMYSAITRLTIKQGEDRALKQSFSEWEKESDPIEHGVSSAYLVKLEDAPASYYVVLTFDSEESRRAYKDRRGELDGKLQDLLNGQPESHLGEIVATVEG